MSTLLHNLIRCSQKLLPEDERCSIPVDQEPSSVDIVGSLTTFLLSCAARPCPDPSWVPSALRELSQSRDLWGVLAEEEERRVVEEAWVLVEEEKRVIVGVMPRVVPLLQGRIKESSIGNRLDGDEVSAASARAPVEGAVVAVRQFRWFLTQVGSPALGKLCALMIPCALTALDHWSPEVKVEGMISFVHLAKNVSAAELGFYEDVILDACCQNIAAADEIWEKVVEMSVVLVTLTQHGNPRSPWYERILNEMFGHLERQPRSKERRVAWLKCIDPLLQGLGLVLLAHFRRLFPLFFIWIHADDDETVLLVLKRTSTIIRLTWIRNTPYIERLADELILLYKEAALKTAREEIREQVTDIMLLLQQCKALQFEAAWEKHADDPNLAMLRSSISNDVPRSTEQSDNLVQHHKFHEQMLSSGQVSL